MAPSFDAARDRAVLEVGPVVYWWRHVEALARRTGTWADFDAQVRGGLVALSEAGRLGTAPSGEEVREAGNAFRRRRRLLAAEDVERWLAQRRLTVSDWRSWLRREIARRRGVPQQLAPDGQDLDAALWVDGVCSGRLAGFAEDLAAKAALFDCAAEADATLRGDEMPSPQLLIAVHDRVVAEQQRIAQLQDVVHEHQLDWTVVRAAAVVVETRDAALEVAAALREGRPAAEVAALAGGEVNRVDGRLVDLPDHLRPQLLALAAGDVADPVDTGSGWTTLRLHERRGASLDEPEVCAAGRETLARRLIGREVTARVIWHERV